MLRLLLIFIGGSVLGVHSSFEDLLKTDFFHIYKNVAVGAREIQNKPVNPEQVNFFLFTRENPNEYIRLDPNNLNKYQNKSCKVVFLIHGWTNDREVPWYEDVKNAFLNRDEEYNVIQIDWKEPANQIYTIASINTYDVAKIIAGVVDNLTIPLENLLFVGHSLGGQICGFIGKHVYKNTGRKLPRIIALDPAGPLFAQRPDDKRLNRYDADIVHVIHTDGGVFGFAKSCGTIDFYPNGGSSQPGCRQIDLADITSITEPVMCDHRRAYEYYSEAILNPKEFVAKKCSSWTKYKINVCDNEEVAMGDLTTTAQGDFYLETNKEKPYSKKQNRNGFNVLKLLQH